MEGGISAGHKSSHEPGISSRDQNHGFALQRVFMAALFLFVLEEKAGWKLHQLAVVERVFSLLFLAMPCCVCCTFSEAKSLKPWGDSGQEGSKHGHEEFFTLAAMTKNVQKHVESDRGT